MFLLRLCLCLALGGLVLTGGQDARGQDIVGGAGLTTNSAQPIEITADGTLEWHRNDLYFTAQGKAIARQGSASIAADLLRADYRKGQKSSMELYRLQATDQVVLISEEHTAQGDRADYDLDKGFAVLTGENLKMISSDQTVTAQERFEYWVEEGRLNAIGQAKVVRPKLGGGTDMLEADKISVFLKDDAQGKRVLDRIEAHGHVVITTPSEIIRGAQGIYRASSNMAELKGGVQIKRGPNILEGARAEVDLTTNISRIFGGVSPVGAQKTRVRGVFYPNSEKPKEKKPDK